MKGNADVVTLTHYSTLESSPDHERRVSRVPTGENHLRNTTLDAIPLRQGRVPRTG